MSMIDKSKKGELRVNGRQFRGRVFTVNDRDVELYPIGALAAALGKTTQAIELWEKAGDFPKSMFRISGKGMGHCKRWYSREQILNIVTVYQMFPYAKGKTILKEAFFHTLRQVWFHTKLVTLKSKERDVPGQLAPYRDTAGSARSGHHPAKPAHASDAPRGSHQSGRNRPAGTDRPTQ
jgi:hypothetical protein